MLTIHEFVHKRCKKNYIMMTNCFKFCFNAKAYQEVLTVVMKNCEPLESGPEFAMDTTPGQAKIKRAYCCVMCTAIMFLNLQTCLSDDIFKRFL